MKHLFAVCAYKESPYLEPLIRSLLSQTEKSGIILCTSTPSPFLEELTGRYHIPYFVREGVPGLCEDWNFALRTAGETGAELVTLAHQDDIYDPSYAGTVIRAAEDSDGSCLAVFTGAGNIDENGKRIEGRAEKIKRILRFPLRFRLLSGSAFWKKKSLSFGNPVPCPACTYYLPLTGTGLFPEGYHFVTDWAALLKLASEEGRLICVEKPLVLIRLHAGQETARTMRDGEREKEEAAIFRSLHSEITARILVHFYGKASGIYAEDARKRV